MNTPGRSTLGDYIRSTLGVFAFIEGEPVFWCGRSSENKLYIQAGFTSTILNSQSVQSWSRQVEGVSCDDVNTLFMSQNDGTYSQLANLFLMSGQFSTTIKDSLFYRGLGSDPEAGTGISCMTSESGPTLWSGKDSSAEPFLYLQQGQFTSTILASLDLSLYPDPKDISYGGITEGDNVPWCSSLKLYVTSGTFTSTIRTSIATYAAYGAFNVDGISFTGIDTIICDDVEEKLYLTSGQFTSTIKESVSFSPDRNPSGVECGDFNARTIQDIG